MISIYIYIHNIFCEDDQQVQVQVEPSDFSDIPLDQG